MTGEELAANYFGPMNWALYILAMLVIMVLYYQWTWAKTRKHNVLLLVARADGHGDFMLAKQTGGCVALKNPNTSTTRVWPISELATVDVPYPGVGFVPAFLQKTIRLVVVDEKDWEPLLNRSPHLPMTASPDVQSRLTEIAALISEEKIKRLLLDFTGDLSATPTREMIASPAVLGNLIMEKVTEAVITVNKEVLDNLAAFAKRIGRVLTPQTFYVGIGAVLIGIVFIAYYLMPLVETVDKMSEQIDAIETAITEGLLK
ncbi:MAG: hypothetical protein KKD77_21685 [Gammaproteobacteria bacterium]|nr:hypothetical protein [Gammaproteobacteria bacterium]